MKTRRYGTRLRRDYYISAFSGSVKAKPRLHFCKPGFVQVEPERPDYPRDFTRSSISARHRPMSSSSRSDRRYNSLRVTLRCAQLRRLPIKRVTGLQSAAFLVGLKAIIAISTSLLSLFDTPKWCGLTFRVKDKLMLQLQPALIAAKRLCITFIRDGINLSFYQSFTFSLKIF